MVAAAIMVMGMRWSRPLQTSTINGLVGLVVIAAIVALLYAPRVRSSSLWTVTVTPLASIIGSGFLISAPVLYDAFGRLALPALIAINLLALGIGLAIRHNMLHFDPVRAEAMRRSRTLGVLGRAASFVLALAYIISVAFYISLLSAFALEAIGIRDHIVVKGVGTAVVVFIGAVGYTHGLHGLESLEKVAVNAKLAIIGGLLVVLVLLHARGAVAAVSAMPLLGWRELRVLGGLLVITQGFETTKYMGSSYAVGPRVRALLLSQLIAFGIYVAFVWLVGPLVIGVDTKSETAIITIIGKLSLVLGFALSIGAVFSQFSAAVADTVGAGGIVEQETRSARISAKRAYPIIALAVIGVIWAFDVFEVMAFASRAFAAYYAIQCTIATITAASQPSSPRRTAKLVGFAALALIAFAIAAFAIASE